MYPQYILYSYEMSQNTPSICSYSQTSVNFDKTLWPTDPKIFPLHFSSKEVACSSVGRVGCKLIEGLAVQIPASTVCILSKTLDPNLLQWGWHHVSSHPLVAECVCEWVNDMPL